jgi:hypothetical protein
MNEKPRLNMSLVYQDRSGEVDYYAVLWDRVRDAG